ncbi:protein btn-1 [Hyaloscypha sp. PMI_1271]|nr:protein btn-1 [Hyaloscypha sp. PMI_1271]
MNRSPSSSGLLPLPGAPGSSWAVYKARLRAIFQGADASVLIAFWLFGVINNVCYVIILSAAVDLVGPSVPKGLVLLADVLPSFLTKLVAPYFIHAIPYSVRIIIMCALSTGGMFLIALTPSVTTDGGSIGLKLFGVGIASLSSGMGELSMLGLTHYYGHFSLAAWGSGTGGAGLIGAGLYVFLTDTLKLSIKNSLLTSAYLPFIMPLAFFLILPQEPLPRAHSKKGYSDIPQISIEDEDIRDLPEDVAAEALLAPGPPSQAAEAYTSHSPRPSSPAPREPIKPTFATNLRRARRLFLPYMLPLLLVYIAEYTINQGISPTLLFPLKSTPFTAYRQFYPMYAFLYQLGVFISRSSISFLIIPQLYLPSLLQIANLALLTLHSLFFFLPSVYLIFLITFWEGLLGGLVYVNTFAKIMKEVREEDREFSLGATSVSDSGGICVASLIGMAVEGRLCEWNVKRGRPWCGNLGG